MTSDLRPRIAGWIRSNYPDIFAKFMELDRKFNSFTQSDHPYITDSLGGSFKSYLRKNDKDQLIKNLKSGLDEESCHTVDVLIERMLVYPDEKDKRKHKHKTPKEPVGGYLSFEEKKNSRQAKIGLAQAKKKFPVKPKVYEESVFYYHHGLTLLPRSVQHYLHGKVFLDCGAYIGDSAIALSGYNYEKIYSIEMSKKSIERYHSNMERNKMDRDRYEIIEMGISASDDLDPIILPDTGSAGFSLFRTTSKYDHIEVVQKSLDFIVHQNHIQPSFIKADIEGAAYEMVKGGVKTFTTNRPVFSIAIYHNPSEFFEIKPFLQKTLPDYTFLIRKLDSSFLYNQCHSETVLIGYPNEITTI